MLVISENDIKNNKRMGVCVRKDKETSFEIGVCYIGFNNSGSQTDIYKPVITIPENTENDHHSPSDIIVNIPVADDTDNFEFSWSWDDGDGTPPDIPEDWTSFKSGDKIPVPIPEDGSTHNPSDLNFYVKGKLYPGTPSSDPDIIKTKPLTINPSEHVGGGGKDSTGNGSGVSDASGNGGGTGDGSGSASGGSVLDQSDCITVCSGGSSGNTSDRVDTTGPVIEFSKNGSKITEGLSSLTVSARDGSGVLAVYYVWSTSPTEHGEYMNLPHRIKDSEGVSEVSKQSSV